MKYAVALAVFFSLSCASANFNHIPPKNPIKEERRLTEQKIYRFSPCEVEKTKLAYVRMAQVCGCSECALYFYRCRHVLCEVRKRIVTGYGKTFLVRNCKLPKLSNE